MSVNKYDKTTGQLIPISGNDVSKPAYFDTKAEAEQALSSISEGSLICTGDEWDTTTYDEVPTQGSENIVKSGGVWNSNNLINSNFGTVELTSTAAYPHAVDETFINAAGQMVKCTAAIAVGDTITTGTNVSTTNVASALSELNSKCSYLVVTFVSQSGTYKQWLNTGIMAICNKIWNSGRSYVKNICEISSGVTYHFTGYIYVTHSDSVVKAQGYGVDLGGNFYSFNYRGDNDITLYQYSGTVQ